MSRSQRAFTLLLPASVVLGCERSADEDRMSAPPPPPAAIIAPVREYMSLSEKLERLQAELDAALARRELDAYARARIFRAEAITDRILESEPPVAWLSMAYGVEAWLRQLQALADRVVAQIRRDEPEQRILNDVIRLRDSVARLRAELARPGGGMPPVPLDTLLANFEVDSMPTDILKDSIGG